jgi:ABC-type bacteriocin/lantibiotic exporter with double-glycine peptidase domain
MSINITKQLNQNECGICVLTSLCKYFYGNKVDKITILEESKLNKNGLSIYDFEILGQKLGISCETYEME